MNVGIKNNTVTLKGGKAAEGCNCCGGWYCYKQCDSCRAGVIPAYIRTSITYTMGDGATTFAMRLRRLQTPEQVVQGYCPDFLGRSNAWPVNQDGDQTLAPRITFTISGSPYTASIDIGLAVSFTDSCDAGNAVRVHAGDNLNSTFHWNLTTGGNVSSGSSLVNGNTFTGAPFVSAAAGFCYGDYPGPGPIPINCNRGGVIYRGTLTLSVTGVE
jgi:hypothetical protein